MSSAQSALRVSAVPHGSRGGAVPCLSALTSLSTLWLFVLSAQGHTEHSCCLQRGSGWAALSGSFALRVLL